MIDWLNLAYNALWVAGLALALAAVSTASWRASLRRNRLADELARPGLRRSLHAAGLLFSLGLGLASPAAWQQAAGAVFTLVFAVFLVRPGVRPS